MISEQGEEDFYFTLGSANYITGPSRQQAQGQLFLCEPGNRVGCSSELSGSFPLR